MATLPAACGCLGPTALQRTRLKYNESFRRTNDEQMLLNIVCLRYGDSPTFIDLPGITSQFEITAHGNFIGGHGNAYPGSTSLGLGEMLFRDAPTLSFQPREGQEIARALMSPLPAEAIRIVRAGLNVEQMLVLVVNEINDVPNAVEANAMAPSHPDDNLRFREVVGLLGALARRRGAEFAIEVKENEVSDPVPAGRVQGRDLVAAAQDHLVFRASAEPDLLQMKKRKRMVILKVAEAERNSFEIAELARVLNIQPGLDSYVIRSEFNDDDDEDDLPNPLGEDDIAINTRSILQMMTFLSKGVQLPPEHVASGEAPRTPGPDGQPFDWTPVTAGLFRVCSSKHRPRGAEVAVRYRGHWFWIPPEDSRSRATMTALELLFALQESDETKGGPLLTLPVGG